MGFRCGGVEARRRKSGSFEFAISQALFRGNRDTPMQ